MYHLFFKRLLDFIFSLMALLLLSPLFVVFTLMLFIVNRGKPFFFQARPGKNEKIFYVVKFKTMNDKVDSNGNLLPDNLRLTILGKFIRKTSIDELPQLINVLKGDMSLIGPRPLLVEYLSIYSKEQRKRHLVKPGITGWAQVNGRNAISWKEKFKLDLFYVDNLSLKLDLKIIILTIFKVLRSEGVNSSDSVTMEKFNGNN